MYYQLCPKCNGQGIVSKPSWITGDQDTWTSTAASYPCDVCYGAKVLLVPDNFEIDYQLLKDKLTCYGYPHKEIS